MQTHVGNVASLICANRIKLLIIVRNLDSPKGQKLEKFFLALHLGILSGVVFISVYAIVFIYNSSQLAKTGPIRSRMEFKS